MSRGLLLDIDGRTLEVCFVYLPNLAHAKGVGITEAIVYDPSPNKGGIKTGFAYCSESESHFSRIRGRKEALAQALQDFSVVERTKIWESIFEKMRKE